MMHAYKDLYEKELKIQYASMESYRSLSNGYSRLLGENKELKRKIAVFTTGPAACSRTPVGRKAGKSEDVSTAMAPAVAVAGAAALACGISPPEKCKSPRGLTWRRCGTSSGDVAVSTGGSSSTLAGTPESFDFSEVDVAGAALACGISSPTKCESPRGLPPLEKCESPRGFTWRRCGISSGDFRDLGPEIYPPRHGGLLTVAGGDDVDSLD